MSLTVKVYLENDEASVRPEIRRFAVDQDVSTSFAYIQKKVAHVFPGIETKPFTLYWKDPEGEYITFSSDHELFEALSQLREDVFRIYVKSINSKPLTENIPHYGVICDVCDGAIIGLRFKCIICPDYDLCGDCERKGCHSHHEMIRMCKPRQDCQGFTLNTHPKDAQKRGTDSCEDQKKSKPYGSNGPDSHFLLPPDFNDFMHQAMQSFWPSTKKSTKNGETSSDSGDETFGDEMRNNFAECVQTVGATVASVLEPMGIEVDVNVKNGGKEKTGENKTKKTPHPEGDVEMQEGGRSSDRTSSNSDCNTKPVSGSYMPTNDATNVGNTKQVNTESTKENFGEGWTFVQKQGTPPYPGTSSSSKQTFKPASATDQRREGTTLPSQRKEGTTFPGQEGVTVQRDHNTQSLDPRIAQLMAQMEEMGFSNDGGWLSQMVLANQGDISKVLDALQPLNQ